MSDIAFTCTGWLSCTGMSSVAHILMHNANEVPNRRRRSVCGACLPARVPPTFTPPPVCGVCILPPHYVWAVSIPLPPHVWGVCLLPAADDGLAGQGQVQEGLAQLEGERVLQRLPVDDERQLVLLAQRVPQRRAVCRQGGPGRLQPNAGGAPLLLLILSDPQRAHRGPTGAAHPHPKQEDLHWRGFIIIEI